MLSFVSLDTLIVLRSILAVSLGANYQVLIDSENVYTKTTWDAFNSFDKQLIYDDVIYNIDVNNGWIAM